MPDIIPRIRDFVYGNFLFNDRGRSLGNDESFLDGGVIDSTGVVEMVGWVEEEFGIEVDDGDILPENFDSVSSLARYVKRKLGD